MRQIFRIYFRAMLVLMRVRKNCSITTSNFFKEIDVIDDILNYKSNFK